MAIFETKSCSRCGGSGHYSYCTMYGTTCFQCGGRKEVLTKRGAAAYDFWRGLLGIKASDVRPGMAIRVPGYNKLRVVSAGIEIDGAKYQDKAGAWQPYFNIRCKGMVYSCFENTVVHRIPTTKAEAESLVSIAVAYQNTLKGAK